MLAWKTKTAHFLKEYHLKQQRTALGLYMIPKKGVREEDESVKEEDLIAPHTQYTVNSE